MCCPHGQLVSPWKSDSNRAMVFFRRHGSQDLPEFQGGLCTTCAASLTEQYLKRLRVSDSPDAAATSADAVSPGMRARVRLPVQPKVIFLASSAVQPLWRLIALLLSHQAKELGKVLQSIALGSIMCDYVDDTDDPMCEREVR